MWGRAGQIPARCRECGRLTQVLLVIDMQTGLWDETAEADRILTVVLGLVARARAAGVPIVWVVDDNVTPPDLHPGLDPGDDAVVHKRFADAFLDTGLGAALAALGATDLTICGFHTDFCVDTTVRRAAQEGFAVMLAADAHGAFDRPGLPAASVVAHHTAVLANLAARGRIVARPAAQITFA